MFNLHIRIKVHWLQHHVQRVAGRGIIHVQTVLIHDLRGDHGPANRIDVLGFDDVLDVEQALDNAGMHFKRRRHFHLGGRDYIDEIAEIKLAAALRPPAGIMPVDEAAADPVDGDGADHLDAPGINNTFDLNDLVGAAADKNVEPRLAGLGKSRGGIQPVAETTGPITAQIDAGQRYPALADQVEGFQQKFIVENFRHAAAQRAIAGWAAAEIQHVIDLQRTADKHIALAFDKCFPGVELELQAAFQAVRKCFGIKQQLRSPSGLGDIMLIRNAVVILQHGQCPQPERQRQQRKSGKPGRIFFKITEQVVRQRQGRQGHRLLAVVEDLHGPAIMGIVVHPARRIAHHLGRREVEQWLPGNLGYRKRFHVLPLAHHVHALDLNGKTRIISGGGDMGGHQPVAPGKQVKTYPIQVRIGTHVQQREHILLKSAGDAVPLLLVVGQPMALGTHERFGGDIVRSVFVGGHRLRACIMDSNGVADAGIKVGELWVSRLLQGG